MADPEGKLTPVQHEILEVVWGAGTVGATVTQSPFRLASSARPSRGSSSTHSRTGQETGNRGCRRRSGMALIAGIVSRATRGASSTGG